MTKSLLRMFPAFFNLGTVGYLLAFLLASAACVNGAQQTYPQPHDPSDGDAEFVPLFDGVSLTGWDGDPVYWRVENGAIVGEVTPDTLLQRNSFLIWRGGVTRDFELKVTYRISARGNSGINYRSEEVPELKHALRGYQADIDGANPGRPRVRHTANNYEERGRTFMALRGQITRAESDGTRTILGSLGDYHDLTRVIREEDWNELHIIARGPTIIHLLNGQVMCVLVDDDPGHRRMEGLLGVQVHVGPPMKIEFRDIRLKALPP